VAIATDKVVQEYLDVEANTSIVCDWPAFQKSDVHVYFGLASDEAIQNDDYTVTLNAPSYSSFTVTPKTALINKINALILANVDEINEIIVVRVLELTTDATSSSVRDSAYTAKEFDRVAMRTQQIWEHVARTFRISRLEDATGYDFELPEPLPGRALVWDAVEKKLVNSTRDVNDDPTAQAVAAAAAAVAAAAAAVPAAATAVAAAAAAAATAAGFLSVPTGGDPAGYVLKRTGVANNQYAWAAPDAVNVGSAILAAPASGSAPLDTSFLGMILADGTLQKFSFVNLRVYLRNSFADITARTGDIKFIEGTAALGGWIKRNGGTIGDATSGATNRANADTVDLYALYWLYDPLDCPIQDSSGAAAVRGANAAADFAAHKRLVIPDTRGYFLRGWDDGRGWDLGRRVGSFQATAAGPHVHNLIMDPVANHQHGMTVERRYGANGGGGFAWSSGDQLSGGTGTNNTAAAGGHTPTGVTGNPTTGGAGESRPPNSAALCVVKL
jgi:hypothetical protein